MKKESVFIGIFGGLFLLSFAMIFLETVSLTGYATEGTTVSNVTISKYLSITMSGNLSGGILFGTINSLPATNVNATGNNNSGGNLTYFINVSTDSNTPVDFCIKANSNMLNGANVLGVGNESYTNGTTNSEIFPSLAGETNFTTDYANAGQGIGQGNSTYFRFYLDVPVATPSGTYNNTINFKAVETTVTCGS